MELQSNSFLCKEVIYCLVSVKAKVYLAKFQQIAKIISFSFFPQEIFFPKSTFKGPVKKIGQSFINEKVCISTSRKVG